MTKKNSVKLGKKTRPTLWAFLLLWESTGQGAMRLAGWELRVGRADAAAAGRSLSAADRPFIIDDGPLQPFFSTPSIRKEALLSLFSFPLFPSFFFYFFLFFSPPPTRFFVWLSSTGRLAIDRQFRGGLKRETVLIFVFFFKYKYFLFVKKNGP